MAFMNWSNDYSVNVDQIDTQHKKLFDMVNGYSDALQQKKSAEAVAQLVNGLALYTISHFRNEEKLFDKYGYPDAENHKKKRSETGYLHLENFLRYHLLFKTTLSCLRG